MVTRILFLGTPDFALPTLRALLDFSDCEVVGVITQPDRKAGRGQKLQPPPVKVEALRQKLRVLQFPTIRNNPEAVEVLAELEVELCVVVAFGQILTPDFFEFPRLGTLNVHASLLPRYRGAAPVIHALLEGETETGVTIMKIDAGMDTGDILSQRALPIPPDTTSGELAPRLAKAGAQLLVETLPGYAGGAIEPQKQDDSKATYAPMIKKQDARIDWRRPAARVHNLVRAFNPWPGATCFLDDEPIKIWRTKPEPSGEGGGPTPGTVVAIREENFVVRCGDDSTIAVMELQLPNRARVAARDFVNGSQLEVGRSFC